MSIEYILDKLAKLEREVEDTEFFPADVKVALSFEDLPRKNDPLTMLKEIIAYGSYGSSRKFHDFIIGEITSFEAHLGINAWYNGVSDPFNIPPEKERLAELYLTFEKWVNLIEGRAYFKAGLEYWEKIGMDQKMPDITHKLFERSNSILVGCVEYMATRGMPPIDKLDPAFFKNMLFRAAGTVTVTSSAIAGLSYHRYLELAESGSLGMGGLDPGATNESLIYLRKVVSHSERVLRNAKIAEKNFDEPIPDIPYFRQKALELISSAKKAMSGYRRDATPMLDRLPVR